MRHVIACIDWAFSFAFVDETGRYLGAINEKPSNDGTDTVGYEVRPVSGGKHLLPTMAEAEDLLRTLAKGVRS